MAQLFLYQVSADFDDIEGDLIVWDKDIYADEGEGPFVGKVLVVPTYYLYDEMPDFMGMDCLAMVIHTSLAEGGQLSLSKGASARAFNWDGIYFQLSDKQFPAFMTVWDLVPQNYTIRVRITKEGNENYWEIFKDSFASIAFQALLAGYALLTVVLGIYKATFAFDKDPGMCNWTLAKAVLVTEIMIGILRVGYFAIDPVNIRILTDIEFNYYFGQVTAPFSIATTTGVLAYWNKIAKYGSTVFKKAKVFIIVILCALIFFGVVVLGILPNFIDPILTTMMSAVFYLIFSIGLSCYTFYTVPQVCNAVKNMPNKKETTEKTTLIFLGGVFSLLWCLPPVIFLMPGVSYAYIWMATWFLWYVLLITVSFVQILVFNSRKESKSTHSIRNLSKSIQQSTKKKNNKPTIIKIATE
eukprot:TRINITY_DN1248_c0_g1_i1.p1 TRINITY_DN1248_c0_g1~~TRINITY_DN1248_c0_g1_i1.p1  ORF type:complete len:412 (+),score=44.41 TRINITY_DN1248_c0_g1_i1:324-1559(+)